MLSKYDDEATVDLGMSSGQLILALLAAGLDVAAELAIMYLN